MKNSGPHSSIAMMREVIKKIRLTRAESKRLARLARRTRRTESEVLREGIDLVETRVDRAKAIEDLIDLINGPEPPKIRWGLKP